MDFLDTILSRLWDASDWFYSAYKTVSDWWWPFNLLQHPLYGLYDVTHSMIIPLAQFNDWLRGVWQKVQEIVSPSQLFKLFSSWIDKAEQAWDWIVNAFGNIWDIISQWWLTIRDTVLSWIDSAKEFASQIVENLTLEFNELRAKWDEFWTKTLPKLADWTGVSRLINTTISQWFPFYDVLATFIGEIGEFFTNPLNYIVSRLEDWFWGEEG